MLSCFSAGCVGLHLEYEHVGEVMEQFGKLGNNLVNNGEVVEQVGEVVGRVGEVVKQVSEAVKQLDEIAEMGCEVVKQVGGFVGHVGGFVDPKCLFLSRRVSCGKNECRMKECRMILSISLPFGEKLTTFFRIFGV